MQIDLQMSRPARPSLLSTQTDECEFDIVEAGGLWTVLYKDKPFNVRKKYYIWKGKTMKTYQTTYPTIAPANNLAEKLNKQFGTLDFTVHKIL